MYFCIFVFIGYGDAEEYGYGESAPAEPDLGYGHAAPDTDDYGYGDATPDTDDYGYGDASPDDMDMGYGEAAPQPPAAEKKRPKRRCSVTKFSLVSTDGPPTGLMAADVIKNFRNAAPPPMSSPTVSDECTKSTTLTEETLSVDSFDVNAMNGCAARKEERKSKGMMGRIRKRLSIIN